MPNVFEAPKLHFLDVPPEQADYARARFVVLPVPYERTTTYLKGTRLGPQYLLNASRQLERYDEETKMETWKAGIHTLGPVATTQADPERFMAGLADLVEPVVRAGKFLVAIGGEHSISAGLVAGVARVHKPVTVLHIDAQCNLRETYEGSRYNHACAAKRMLDHAQKVVEIGIRSIADEELPLLASKGRVRAFLMHEHRDVRTLVPRVLDELSGNVYISIDLDALDPAVVPGVGTPQPGGFGWYEALDVLRAVIQTKNVVAMDVVELCPIEGEVISEFAAAKLVYRAMGYVHAKDRGVIVGERARASKGSAPASRRRRAKS